MPQVDAAVPEWLSCSCSAGSWTKPRLGQVTLEDMNTLMGATIPIFLHRSTLECVLPGKEKLYSFLLEKPTEQ